MKCMKIHETLHEMHTHEVRVANMKPNHMHFMYFKGLSKDVVGSEIDVKHVVCLDKSEIVT